MLNMAKRLEVEMNENLKLQISSYAKKKGLRLPFAYGELLRVGLDKLLNEEQTKVEDRESNEKPDVMA
jgi:hypothetical protein